jgi:hypothetical protein
MKYALYVDDPIGYLHLIAEFNDLKRRDDILHNWIRMSKDWKQWKLDYPEHCNLLWQCIPVKGYMSEIVNNYRNYRPKIVTRKEWEELYDHVW